jgi:hypothetical protein
MATTQTIDATIFASSHPDIAKRTSVSGVLISSVMLLVGILAFASTFELEDKSSTVSMALMVWGQVYFLWEFSVFSGNQRRLFIYQQKVWLKSIVYSLI